MTQEERAALKVEADKISGLFRNICRECMHCLEKFECPQGIDFPSILGNHSRYQIAKKLGKDAAPYVENYRKMEGLKADSCGMVRIPPGHSRHDDTRQGRFGVIRRSFHTNL